MIARYEQLVARYRRRPRAWVWWQARRHRGTDDLRAHAAAKVLRERGGGR